ncbi:MAG: tRNA (adenosine(37)-N6)-dimethylallyltransferase MiaA [Candidatus Omnitrophota bacterium]
MKKNPLVLFIVGPTASGKSALAVALAKKLDGEILSADSMLVYKGMDIGTAKPTKKERGDIPHYGLDLIPPTKSFSVFAYRQYALKVLKDIVRRGKIPIVAGGTGFYVRALLEGLSPLPGTHAAIRAKLEREAQAKGLPALYKRLRKLDPRRAKAIGPHNQRRIIRALEIYLASGKKPSEPAPKTPGLRELGYKPFVIGLHRDREALYQKINQRVDTMFRKGLVREVTRLARKKLSKTALQGVGYKETLDWIKNKSSKIPMSFPRVISGNPERGSPIKAFGDDKARGTPVSINDVKNTIKQTTRHFAKRQWTWFKRESGICWVWWPEGASLKSICDLVIQKFQRL